MRRISTIIYIGIIILLNISNLCFAQFTKILDFTGTANGNAPSGDLLSDGNYLYGMTSMGGTKNKGVIFKINPDGTGYSDLFNFSNSPNASTPIGSLISDGTYLYGMTKLGGTKDFGTIFKINPDGTGFVKLLDFVYAVNGSNPQGSLFYDGTFLYGMAFSGGPKGFGLIFKIKTDGTGFTNLMDFTQDTQGNYPNGSNPQGSLISDGTFLYGTTTAGGTKNFGVIFKIKTDGTGFTKLFDFDGISNGNTPQGSLIIDKSFLYGMTTFGGKNSAGTIFKIKSDGSGYTNLHDFEGFPTGANPWGSVILEGSYLYGLARNNGAYNGAIFRIKPDGTGYADIYDFVDPNNGAFPQGSLTFIGSSLYGMTFNGGTNNSGTIFKFDLGNKSDVSQITNIKTQISSYPNPTNGKFFLESDVEFASNNVLEIYNTLGEMIYTNTFNNIQNLNEIDISNNPKGMYLLKINLGGKIFTNKIVIQ